MTEIQYDDYGRLKVLTTTERAVKVQVNETMVAWVPKKATDSYTDGFTSKEIVDTPCVRTVQVADWFELEPFVDKKLKTEHEMAVKRAETEAKVAKFNEKGYLTHGQGKHKKHRHRRPY